MAKIRLDLLLLERNLFDTRKKAQVAIMSGVVKVGNKIIDKAGTLIHPDEEIIITKNIYDGFVSRGGLKLEKAISTFKPDIKDKVFLDIGASTGGFTDCLLRNGAKFVYAIDVGYGQIDWKLRTDERVRVIERCNARYLEKEKLYKPDDFIADGAVMDVSFISVDKIIPNLINLLKPEFYIMTLIKPQFEAGKENIKKGGIVDSPKVHKEVLENFKNFVEKTGLHVVDITYSPIQGATGNIEFLGYISSSDISDSKVNIDKIIEEAYSNLKHNKNVDILENKE